MTLRLDPSQLDAILARGNHRQAKNSAARPPTRPAAKKTAATPGTPTGAKPRSKPRHLEAAEQKAVVSWARDRCAQDPARWPLLDRLFCSLAGHPMTPAQAARAKEQGNRKGVPDLVLLVPRRGFRALVIEMKEPKGSPTAEQIEEIDLLSGLGYAARICYGRMEAIDFLRWYYAEN